LSVECPKNAPNYVKRGDIAERCRKLESTLKKLVFTGKSFESHLAKILRKNQDIVDSHPVHQEYRAWERQFKDALTQAEKSLVN
jgi:hypothetical protein